MDPNPGTIACPYCAQPISPQAVVCHHCRQNVALTVALTMRIAELERELGEVRATVDGLQRSSGGARQPDAPPALPAEPGWRDFVTPTIVNVCAYGVFAVVVSKDLFTLPGAIGIALLLVPFASGVWLGLHFPVIGIGKHLVADASVIAAGVGPFIVEDVIDGRLNFPQDTLMTSAIFFVPGLLSASGGLMGKWIRRLRSGAPRQDVPTRIADRIIRGLPTESPRATQWVPTLASLLAAIAPLLTFFASVIGAYLAYLGAIAGKAGAR